jgi:methionyl-tRNA formyltransferase
MTAGPAPGRAADPVRTVFFGSGPFAVPILDAVAADPRLELVGVVTAPDRPAGRGKTLLPTPVALRARTMWAPLLQPMRLREPEAISRIAELRPALGVLADYGQIVPAGVLQLPELGILNIHPSLLPRHRGASPIQATIAAGDPESGVTIMQMDTGLDTGPIVARQAWATTGLESAPDLERHAAREGAALLGRTLDGWLTGEIRPEPQPETGATLTRRLRRADAALDPARSAAELERRVRAHVPWPGSNLATPAGGLTVHRASVARSDPGDEPGTLVRHGDGLALATLDGRLVLDEVQLSGRRRLSGAEFLRGQRELLGAKVGAAAETPAAPETADAARTEAGTTESAMTEPASTKPARTRAVRA